MGGDGGFPLIPPLWYVWNVQLVEGLSLLCCSVPRAEVSVPSSLSRSLSQLRRPISSVRRSFGAEYGTEFQSLSLSGSPFSCFSLSFSLFRFFIFRSHRALCRPLALINDTVAE